jgi:hypothetical protein
VFVLSGVVFEFPDVEGFYFLGWVSDGTGNKVVSL